MLWKSLALVATLVLLCASGTSGEWSTIHTHAHTPTQSPRRDVTPPDDSRWAAAKPLHCVRVFHFGRPLPRRSTPSTRMTFFTLRCVLGREGGGGRRWLLRAELHQQREERCMREEM